MKRSHLKLIFLTITLVLSSARLSSSSNSYSSSKSTFLDDNNSNKKEDRILNLETPNVSYTVSTDDTTVQYSSWSDEVANSFWGFLFGILLIICAIPVLWYNERRYIKEDQIIKSGSKICAVANPLSINPDDNNELIHLTGETNTKEIIFDKEFEITASNAMRLKRVIEVYQMQETSSSRRERDTFGGGTRTITTYHHKPVWSTSKIDSNNFHSYNQRNSNDNVKFITTNQTLNVNTANVGCYFLTSDQISVLNKFEALMFPPTYLQSLPQYLIQQINELNWKNKSLAIEGPYLAIHQAPGQTLIGDIRISFEIVKCGPITIVAEQNGETFVPYDIKKRKFRRETNKQGLMSGGKSQIRNTDERGWTCDQCDTILETVCICCCCCKCIGNMMETKDHINWIFEANYSKEETFRHKSSLNNQITWILRAIGWLMLLIGLILLFSPIATFFSFVSFLGDAVSLAAFIISFVLSLGISLIIISLSWVVHRPILFIPILLISIGAVCYVIFNTHEKKVTTTGE